MNRIRRKTGVISSRFGSRIFFFSTVCGTRSLRFLAKLKSGRIFGLPKTPSVQIAQRSQTGPRASMH